MFFSFFFRFEIIIKEFANSVGLTFWPFDWMLFKYNSLIKIIIFYDKILLFFKKINISKVIFILFFKLVEKKKIG